MKRIYPLITCFVLGVFLFANAYGQRNSIKTRSMHLSTVADTVALEAYIWPVKNNILAIDSVVQQPGSSKNMLLVKSRQTLLMLFPEIKPGMIITDSLTGTTTVNDFIHIYDKAYYVFRLQLAMVAQQDRYKISIRIPRYISTRDRFGSLNEFETISHPLTDLANASQLHKRERMRVLIDLNKRSWDLLNRYMREMKETLAADF